MPKTEQQNTTLAAAPGVSQNTRNREWVAGTNGHATGRHPAEAALVEIAEEIGGNIEIMASTGGDLDVTIPSRYRIEVREMGVRVVPLSSPRWEGDALGKAWLCPEGTDAMIRLLTAIQAAPSGDQIVLRSVQ